jgi:phosphate starvation-inducible membrane PsiE
MLRIGSHLKAAKHWQQAKNKPMIHLIWSIINGIIILYFFYLIIGFIVKGKRIFKPQFKVVSIFMMVIGIVQIISASNSEKNTNRITITKDYNKKNDL